MVTCSLKLPDNNLQCCCGADRFKCSEENGPSPLLLSGSCVFVQKKKRHLDELNVLLPLGFHYFFADNGIFYLDFFQEKL